MVIDGRHYHADLIIYPDGRIETPWRRKAGHRLTSDDIRALIESGPEVIIAGTGVSGLVKPVTALEELLERRGITFLPAPNDNATKIFNDLVAKRKVGACFHLTC